MACRQSIDPPRFDASGAMRITSLTRKGASVRLQAILFCAMSALSISSTDAWSAPCFVVPLPGATARVAEGALQLPRRTADCSSLEVTAGAVRVVYSDDKGESHTPLIKANEHFMATDATAKLGPYANVEDAPRVKPVGSGPIDPKLFDAAREAEAYGLPSGNLFVPAEGFRLRLRKFDGNTTYQVVPRSGGAVVASGVVTGGVLSLQRTGLKPGVNYELRVVLPDHATPVAAIFHYADADDVAALDRSLADLGRANLDRVALAYARALLFDQNSFTVNTIATMQDVQP
jgi:hypothetical protein